MRLHLVVISLLLIVACGGRVEDSRSFVDSESPSTFERSAPEDTAPEWETVSHGVFVGLDHTGEGNVRVLERDGIRMIEFSEFRTDKAPDLRVYISPDGTLNNAVDLGKLESASGYQTYGVPGFIDTSEYKYVLVHCRAFNVMFAEARLE